MLFYGNSKNPAGLMFRLAKLSILLYPLVPLGYQTIETLYDWEPITGLSGMTPTFINLGGVFAVAALHIGLTWHQAKRRFDAHGYGDELIEDIFNMIVFSGSLLITAAILTSWFVFGEDSRSMWFAGVILGFVVAGVVLDLRASAAIDRLYNVQQVLRHGRSSW